MLSNPHSREVFDTHFWHVFNQANLTPLAHDYFWLPVAKSYATQAALMTVITTNAGPVFLVLEKGDRGQISALIKMSPKLDPSSESSIQSSGAYVDRSRGTTRVFFDDLSDLKLKEGLQKFLTQLTTQNP